MAVLRTLTYILFLINWLNLSAAWAAETPKLPVEQSKTFLNEKKFVQLYQEGNAALEENTHKAIRIALDLQLIAIKQNKPELTFLAYYFLGKCNYTSNNPEKARENYEEAKKIAIKYGWYPEQVKIAILIGTLYFDKGTFKQAAQHLNKAIQLGIDHKVNKYFLLEAYERLGYVNYIKGTNDYSKARNFFQKGYETAKELNDPSRAGVFLVHLSQIEMLESNNYEAVHRLNTAIESFQEVNDIDNLITAYKTLADYYYNAKKNDSALIYYQKAYAIRDRTSPTEQAVSSTDIAYMYGLTGDKERMFQYADSAMKYARFDKRGNTKKYVYKWLADILTIKKEYKEAARYFQLHNNYLDSLVQTNANDALIQQGLQLDFDNKMERMKMQREKEKEIERKEQEHQSFLAGIYLVGFVIVLILFIVILLAFSRNKKQKKIIEQQHVEVSEKSRIIEEKNKEMIDSINYAQRLQSGLLPSKNDLSRIFPESFIYFNPKDIVSGDFYWFHRKGRFVYIACGDCTGHGVPGSLMSVLGINLLNDIIESGKATEPSLILDQLRNGIIKSLNKEDKEGEYKDGMDISLVRLDVETKQCVFAGANNGMYKISGKELTEVKATKQPVGYNPDMKPFVQETVNLNKGDFIVLFTDGYADQFGGVSNKKYMYKTFKEFLVKTLSRGTNHIEQEMETEFNSWKGNTEQVDDVCVLGIRI